MHRSSWLISLVALPLFLMTPPALPAEPAAKAEAEPQAAASQPATCPICGRVTNPATYADKAGTTLVRGASNTLFGWTELLRQPAQEAKQGGNVLVGIGKGIGLGLKRTLAGVGEVLTFWTPKTNDGYIQFATDCPICMKSSP